jgi:hypothetical protein
LCAVGTEGGDAGYPEDGEARRDEEEEGGDGHHATDLLLRVELRKKKKTTSVSQEANGSVAVERCAGTSVPPTRMGVALITMKYE